MMSSCVFRVFSFYVQGTRLKKLKKLNNWKISVLGGKKSEIRNLSGNNVVIYFFFLPFGTSYGTPCHVYERTGIHTARTEQKKNPKTILNYILALLCFSTLLQRNVTRGRSIQVWHEPMSTPTQHPQKYVLAAHGTLQKLNVESRPIVDAS